MKTLTKTRPLGPAAIFGVGILTAAVLCLALPASAADKEPLKDHFEPQYERFTGKTIGKVVITSGPKAVKMRQGGTPGKQWTATSGLYALKLTIEDKAECKIDDLVAIVEKLPPSYMSIPAAVSGEGSDGVAVYASIEGATARGGKGYLDITPTADALAVARAMGLALAKTTESEENPVMKQWEAAIAGDKVSVSTAGDASPEDDIAQYAELFAVCMCDREEWRFSELQRLSVKRFALWAQMLKGPSRAPGGTRPAAKVSEEQIAEAKRLGVPVTFTNSLGMQFVLIPAGKFTMGSRDSAREVANRCNMSQAQIGWFKPHSDPRRSNWQIMRCPAELLGPDKPVVFVGQDDAASFFGTLNQLEAAEGRKYSLPTESQWEYACRAGSTTPFSFGETLSTEQANYDGRYTYADGKTSEALGQTTEVGSLAANAWGLHDMHGNVAEWCSDWYADYTPEAKTDPSGPTHKTRTQEHAIRGGSWRSYPGACRSACRLKGSWHSFRRSHIGFRAVCLIPANPEEQKQD